LRVRELRVEYRSRPDLPAFDGRTSLKTPTEATAFLAPVLDHEPGEVFVVLFLNTKHQLLSFHEVSRGTLDSTLVHPREVFKAALLANAAAIVLAHNHPSGDPSPSPDDDVLTRRLKAAGDLLGVDVVDHVIVGDGRHYSFKEGGRL
jgi:DNA repair protein RadC